MEIDIKSIPTASTIPCYQSLLEDFHYGRASLVQLSLLAIGYILWLRIILMGGRREGNTSHMGAGWSFLEGSKILCFLTTKHLL